jgi:transcription initiation factor TFIIIB Brf1 subunit/transcription initiation factor TFIIB
VEEENATKPVIGGKPVHFVLDSADDQADPRTGTTVAQKLVDDGIKGMLGHFNSGTTIPLRASTRTRAFPKSRWQRRLNTRNKASRPRSG